MKTRELTKTAVMIALLIICSQLAIPLGPVPITLQTFAVLIIGLTLQPSYAVVATALYAVMGLAGLPVFSGGSGGFGSLLSPSFGFVIAFIPATAFLSYFINKYQNKSILNLSIGVLITNVIIYTIGLVYMYFIFSNVLNIDSSLTNVLQLGLIPFIPGDFLKAALAIVIYRRLELVLGTYATK